MEHAVEEREGVSVVRVEGPIDIASAIELRDLLGAQLAGPASRVLLDLSGVTLIDSSGVGVLVTAHRTADTIGARLALAGASATVGRVFELTRTNKLLRIYPSVGEALAALRE
jgi:anti-anti-sigma factor